MNVQASDGPHASTFEAMQVYQHRTTTYSGGGPFYARYLGRREGRALVGGLLNVNGGVVRVASGGKVEMSDPRHWLEVRRVGDGYAVCGPPPPCPECGEPSCTHGGGIFENDATPVAEPRT